MLAYCSSIAAFEVAKHKFVCEDTVSYDALVFVLWVKGLLFGCQTSLYHDIQFNAKLLSQADA